MTIARQAHIKAADIVIDPNHIRHIENEHKEELETLHISALTHVKTIANFFTEIRQRPRNAVLLVLENDDKESMGELYLADDDTVIVSGDLMEGLDKELDDFFNDLMKK